MGILMRKRRRRQRQSLPAPHRSALQTGPSASSVHPFLQAQGTVGNQAVQRWVQRKGAVDIKNTAEKLKAEVAGGKPSDEVDPFLESRHSLYKVNLVGTNIHVSLPRSHSWTARYTSRALTEGAVLAAFNVIYYGGAKATQIRTVYGKWVGHGVKHVPAKMERRGEGSTHEVIIDAKVLSQFAQDLNLPRNYMRDAWRQKVGQAEFLKFALDLAYDAFDQMAPHFTEAGLARSKISIGQIRMLLQKYTQGMIETAKRHPAAGWWRDTFAGNLELHWAERGPALGDFPRVPWSKWATTILELATATRTTLNLQLKKQHEEERKHYLNEHLRPHEIEVDDAAKFILETFAPTSENKLPSFGAIIRGGQTLSNIRGEPIFLLRVRSDEVIFQHLGDKRLYKQSTQGFDQEQVFGVLVEAGKKSQGAVTLTKWVLGIAGAVFPPVRYGLMATDVINAAFQIQKNHEELEGEYRALMVAYQNIDKLLPGVLPQLLDAVLDKGTASLFNPLAHPDLGAWLKVIIRLVIMRQTKVAKASYAADAVKGFFNKAFAAIKKGLGVLLDVVVKIIVVAPAVAGSTGVTGDRALKVAAERLQALGVQAWMIVQQIKGLPEGDQKRLVRELQELGESGTRLLAAISKTLSW